MKIAYIVALTDSKLINAPSSGIKKKIDWQTAALSRAGIVTVLMKKKCINKIIRALPFQTASIDWKRCVRELDGYDGLYHRHVYTDYQMLRAFRFIKKRNPEFKIVLELPTYPYEKERKHGLMYYRDIFYRRFLRKYIDRIVVFGNFRRVWGIPCIRTRNGIDMELTAPKKSLERSDGFDLCMIADLEFWHGVDRLLNGLVQYYENNGTEDIKIHLVCGVSNTKKLLEIKNVIEKSILKDKVILYRNLSGKDLDKVYDICHMASASLGRHRTKLDKAGVTSEIKTREYLAKGIPFIYSTEIDVFENNHADFAKQISTDDKPVNFSDVVDFYKHLLEKYDKQELKERIRKFGQETVSMDKTMEPVVQFYKKKNR